MIDWRRAVPLLQAALDAEKPRPLWRVEDVYAAVRDGSAHLLQSDNAVMVVTSPDPYPTGEVVMEAWLAGGRLDEVLAMVPALEQRARFSGCTIAQVVGRAGWVKTLAPHGYKQEAIILRKQL